MNNRKAVVGDELIVTQFNPSTRGLADVTQPNPDQLAVCLLPGTEVGFDKPITLKRKNDETLFAVTSGTFKQFEVSFGHRDGFVFPNGEDCLIQSLPEGVRLKVLQLPAPKIEAKAEEPAPEHEPEHETFFA